jgi:hypothetical protein
MFFYDVSRRKFQASPCLDRVCHLFRFENFRQPHVFEFQTRGNPMFFFIYHVQNLGLPHVFSIMPQSSVSKLEAASCFYLDFYCSKLVEPHVFRGFAALKTSGSPMFFMFIIVKIQVIATYSYSPQKKIRHAPCFYHSKLRVTPCL